jgi:hypothetical protein
MSLIKRKKKADRLSYRDNYFMFKNEWFIKTEEDGVIGVRSFEQNLVIPEEYIKDWQDVDSSKVKYDSIKISYVKMNKQYNN